MSGQLIRELHLAVAVLACALALLAASAAVAQDVPGPKWIDHPMRPFSITATEITVGQYRSCVESGRCDVDTVSEECNYGRDGYDDHPVNCVTHTGAEQYCAAAGGRLCSQEQWLAACRGVEQRSFPYGDEFDLAVCNSRSPTVEVDGRNGTVRVGSMPVCEGGLPGLMDMAGNVTEWLADCKGTYCKFRGGGHLSNDPIGYFAACSGVCAGNQKTLKSATVGIRCCREMVSAP